MGLDLIGARIPKRTLHAVFDALSTNCNSHKESFLLDCPKADNRIDDVHGDCSRATFDDGVNYLQIMEDVDAAVLAYRVDYATLFYFGRSIRLDGAHYSTVNGKS